MNRIFHETNKRLYGKEIVIDLRDCDKTTFSIKHLEKYFVELCNLIDMKRHGEPLFWPEENPLPHLKGVSAIQFIETSNIVVHTLEALDAAFVNLFSCATFDPKIVEDFTKNFFKAKKIKSLIVDRELLQKE